MGAYDVGDDLKVRRAEAGTDRMRGFASFDYAARSWSRERRVVARLEASARGFDARYIVTSLAGEPRHLYEALYCARGQAENLIKLHKVQLASDRTSCQSPLANQFRLVLHTAAYWLMLARRSNAAISPSSWTTRTSYHRARGTFLRRRLVHIPAAVDTLDFGQCGIRGIERRCEGGAAYVECSADFALEMRGVMAR